MPDLNSTVDLSAGIGAAVNPFINFQAPIVDSNGDGWRDTVLKITLNPNQETSLGSGVAYTSAYFQVEYTGASTGVSVNIGDSVTNDSWAGDGATQSRDAEIQVGVADSTSKTFSAYGNDYTGSSTTTGESWVTNGGIVSNNTTNFSGAVDGIRLLKSEPSFASTNPTSTLHFTVRNELLAYGNNNGVAGYLEGGALYALGGQTDAEGPVNYDIYAAFNRVVAGSYRSGTGVGKVTVTLGTDDYLAGDINANTLDAGAGNDYIDGDQGNDTIIGNHGFDYIDGGAGTDNVSYSSLNQSIIVEFTSSEITVKKAEGTKDTLVNVETLTASASLVDTINFSNSTVGVTASLSSYAGVSLVNFDNIQGSSFNDSLTGNTLANQLNGGAGNDTLNGSSGNDTLIGGAGNDKLTGGLNTDQFLFSSPNEGLDTITDFSSAQGDKIAISKAGFSLPASTTSLGVSASATGTAAQFIFNSTSKILAFDSDGIGSNAAVSIATLPTVTSLSASNFVYM